MDIRCISDFQKTCASKTAGLRVKDKSRSLCYSVLCGHCLPSCPAERQAPGLLVFFELWAAVKKRKMSFESKKYDTAFLYGSLLCRSQPKALYMPVYSASIYTSCRRCTIDQCA